VGALFGVATIKMSRNLKNGEVENGMENLIVGALVRFLSFHFGILFSGLHTYVLHQVNKKLTFAILL
jgi:hypothetical protein